MNILLTSTTNSIVLFLIIIFIIFVLAWIILIMASVIENSKIRINQFIIDSHKIPKEFEGYKIVFLTDLHNVTFGKNNCTLISRIDEINPDVILIGGDMIVGKPNYPVDIPIRLINILAEKYPIYYGMGNHELRVRLYEKYGDMWSNYSSQLDSRVNLLMNKKVKLTKDGENISLYGLDIDKMYYNRHKTVTMTKQYLQEVLEEKSDEEYNILIAHNPEYFDAYSSWGADLTLSGHNHGGIIYLPFFGGIISTKAKMFPVYDKGLFVKEGSKMILSSGLGSHTIKIRFNNIPEIILIELHKK